jgi:hypothetical protein
MIQVCCQVLQKVREEAEALDAGILFLGEPQEKRQALLLPTKHSSEELGRIPRKVTQKIFFSLLSLSDYVNPISQIWLTMVKDLYSSHNSLLGLSSFAPPCKSADMVLITQMGHAFYGG